MRVKKFNVGIIGYGWAATAHISAINATRLGQVAAICSGRKLDSAELAAKYHSPIQVFSDLGQMLSHPEIDVISVCGFPDQHADHSIRAARAGKHLIIEKPVCLSADDLSRVQDAVAQAGIRAC